MTREQFIRAACASSIATLQTATEYCDAHPKDDYSESEFSKLPLSHHWQGCADDKWRDLPLRGVTGRSMGKTTAYGNIQGNSSNNTDWC